MFALFKSPSLHVGRFFIYPGGPSRGIVGEVYRICAYFCNANRQRAPLSASPDDGKVMWTGKGCRKILHVYYSGLVNIPIFTMESKG